MNLNHLKAFVKVVQTGSFKEAAKHLSVSQPAITQRIQTLEEYLKTKLFSKEGEGLTSHGKTLYERSVEILALWEQVEREIWGTKVTGRLTLGASTIPSEYILPAILKSYRAIYPDVRPQLRISGTKEVLRWLRDRSIDLAFTGEPFETAGILAFPVAADQMNLIAPADTEWTESVSHFEELLETEWIMREPESDTRRTFESYLCKKGIQLQQLRISGQLESTEAVIAAVEAGLGISAVSSLAAERALKLGRVKIINLVDFSIQRKFYCSCLEDQKDTSVLSTFLTFVKNRKNDGSGL